MLVRLRLHSVGDQMKPVALLIALTICAAAQAGPIQFYTGNELYERIKSQEFVKKSVALGFVIGVHDTLDGITSCAPDSVTAKQVLDIVERFLDQYPEGRHLSATSLVRNALAKAWPCKNKL